MDSYIQYKEICKIGTNLAKSERMTELQKIVKSIVDEVMTVPCNLNNSSFMREAMKVIDLPMSSEDLGEIGEILEISLVDARAILDGVLGTLKGEAENALKNNEMIADYLFCNKRFTKEYMKNGLAEQRKCIQEIEAIIAQEKTETMQNLVEHESVDSVRQVEVQEQVQENHAEEEAYMQRRVQANQESVRLWHQDLQGIQRTLGELQPSVSQVLQGFMNFSEEITNNYVLRWANKQIELYDLIFDAYAHHAKQLEQPRDEEYKNAVDNYEEFMDMIMDELADFGVETIYSEAGQSFDGNIHECEQRDFSGRTAVVKESIRPGFRYGELIIRKEKVIV